MAQTALQILIEDIKANIAGCACNLNESGLSEKERAHYNGAIIAGKDALRKATELRPKERQDIIDGYNQDLYGGLSGSKKFNDGEDYFSQTFNHDGFAAFTDEPA